MARTLIIAVIVLATYATENHGEVRGLNRYFKALDINVPPDVDPLLDVSEIQNDESSINTLRCNDWYSMAWSFKKCLNVTETGFPSISDLRMTLENFCSKQSVVEHCMEREFRGCENVADLEAMLATSMSFCVGGNIPYVMELYLAFHAQLNITQECWMTVILDIQKFSLSTCSNYLRDKNEGLVEVQRFWKSMIDWYAACAASQDLDVIIEACQLSRRQMFSILLASLQVMFGFGLNHYPNFEAYMKLP